MENWRFLEFVVLFVSTCCCSGGTFTESCKFEPLQANQETIRNFMRSRNLMRADMRKIADSNSPQKSAEVCLSDAPAKRYLSHDMTTRQEKIRPHCSTLLHTAPHTAPHEPPANVLIDQNLRAGSALGARTTCQVRTRLIDERLL